MAVEKLKENLLSRITQLNPSISIDSHHASSIEQRLQDIFNVYHAPTHPPYACMIQRAITELNEESGSTEEAICEFIKMEHENLPWAHSTIVNIHLGRLCIDESIVQTSEGRYRFRRRVEDFTQII